MRAILVSTGRSLWRHWPALLAWYLAGIAVHYVFIQLAGFVGAYSATAGFLILPLAILARLVSMVAMFLVLRDGLAELGAIAPLPDSPAERRRSFVSAMMAGILPFVAVYWAQGLLREDVNAYSARALRERSNIIWLADGQQVSNVDTVLNVPLSVWTALIIVASFTARWAWTKWSKNLAGWLAPVAAYFEVVWVFFSVLVIGELTDQVQGWVDTRVGTRFLEQVRENILDAVAPLGWLWDGLGWIVGEAGPILLAPLAWLTIGGVVYGQAIVAEKLQVELDVIKRLRDHAALVPNPVMRRLKDLGGQLSSRFRPIGRALLLMWRAGPVLVASYALVFVAVGALESYLRWGVTRLIGPQDTMFWGIAYGVVMLLPMLLIEPLRIAVIAGAYDATLGRLRRRQAARADAEGTSAEEADVRAVADAAGLLPGSIDAVASASTATGQGSIENLTNVGSVRDVTSSQNGPETSSGSTNPTTS